MLYAKSNRINAKAKKLNNKIFWHWFGLTSDRILRSFANVAGQTCYRGQIAAEMKLASKCVGRSKRLTQPKLNLEKQPDTFLSLSHTHTPAQWAISAVGVVSGSVSTWSSFYLCRVVVIFVVVVVAIAVLRLLLLMGFRDLTTPNTSGGPAKIDRHNAI